MIDDGFCLISLAQELMQDDGNGVIFPKTVWYASYQCLKRPIWCPSNHPNPPYPLPFIMLRKSNRHTVERSWENAFFYGCDYGHLSRDEQTAAGRVLLLWDERVKCLWSGASSAQARQICRSTKCLPYMAQWFGQQYQMRGISWGLIWQLGFCSRRPFVYWCFSDNGRAGHADHVPASLWVLVRLPLPLAGVAVLLAHLETIRRLNYWGYAVPCLVVSFFWPGNCIY